VLFYGVKLAELADILKVINLGNILFFEEAGIDIKVLILKGTNTALQNIR
jgi:hypothetical protein